MDAHAAAALALGLNLLTRRAAASEPKLLVFLHVAVKQRALQSELSAALPGVDVTAVGRVADFERALADGQDAVLSLPMVLAAHGFTARLRGMRQGSYEEKYSLVAADLAPELGRVAAVGALDLFGREGTNSFVFTLLGAKPKVERVTKVEDLLPLLQMRRVDAVLLPSRLFSEVKSSSRLNLFARELAATVPLPAVASVRSSGDKILGAVGTLPRALSKTFGVEEWR
jgi:hypothetical protein